MKCREKKQPLKLAGIPLHHPYVQILILPDAITSTFQDRSFSGLMEEEGENIVPPPFLVF